MEFDNNYIKGRGAQLQTKNPFLKHEYVKSEIEGLDEPWEAPLKTEVMFDNPKKILNKINSPDLSNMYSINPYQGCEHGCIYCYARNSHTYWGFTGGVDFETKIVVKQNAPDLLVKHLANPNWSPHPITLSGNTDCYQPLERKYKLTRQLLEIFLKYNHPVTIITKNSLILRDKDIVAELAKKQLINVTLSITSLDEKLRQVMEPRTATAANRLRVIRELSAEGVSCGVMTAPIIPGLTSHEIPELIRAAAENGATHAGYTIVRLNGTNGSLFVNWLKKNRPDAAEKVIHQIEETHNGKLNDSRFGARMRGDGKVAEIIKQLFDVSVARYMKNKRPYALDTTKFIRPYKNASNSQLRLFE